MLFKGSNFESIIIFYLVFFCSRLEGTWIKVTLGLGESTLYVGHVDKCVVTLDSLTSNSQAPPIEWGHLFSLSSVSVFRIERKTSLDGKQNVVEILEIELL